MKEDINMFWVNNTHIIGTDHQWLSYSNNSIVWPPKVSDSVAQNPEDVNKYDFEKMMEEKPVFLPVPEGVPHAKMWGTLEIWMWCWAWMEIWYPQFLTQHVVKQHREAKLMLPWVALCVRPGKARWEEWKEKTKSKQYSTRELLFGLLENYSVPRLLSLASGSMYHIKQVGWPGSSSKAYPPIFSPIYATYNWKQQVLKFYKEVKKYDI